MVRRKDYCFYNLHLSHFHIQSYEKSWDKIVMRFYQHQQYALIYILSMKKIEY